MTHKTLLKRIIGWSILAIPTALFIACFIQDYGLQVIPLGLAVGIGVMALLLLAAYLLSSD